MEHIKERNAKDKQAAGEKTPEARPKVQVTAQSAQETKPLKSEVYKVTHTHNAEYSGKKRAKSQDHPV